MNIRQEWLNTDNTSQFYSAEETISEVKDNFDIRRYYSAEGADVIVDGVTCRALIQYFTNPLNQAKYDRKLHVPMEININTGSIIDYDGFKWLVTGSIDDIQAYKSAGMVKCNNTTLNFYDQSHILHEIPCIINKSLTLDTNENKYITTVDNEFYLTVANTSITQQIKVNNIYKIGTYNYQISSVPDDISQNGLLIFKMKYNEVEQESHVYQLSILNSDSLQISQSQQLIINCELKDNNVIISSPTLVYSSSNETIATISNIGEVTILGLGTVTFNVSMESDLSINDSINVEIIQDEIHNYTVEIVGTNFITKGFTSNYNCVFKDNGNLITSQSEFYLTADDGVSTTTLAEVVSQDSVNNTCVMKGNNIGYVKLFTKNLDGSIVSNGFRVQIKNLF